MSTIPKIKSQEDNTNRSTQLRQSGPLSPLRQFAPRMRLQSWLASLVVHLILLVALGLLSFSDFGLQKASNTWTLWIGRESESSDDVELIDFTSLSHDNNPMGSLVVDSTPESVAVTDELWTALASPKISHESIQLFELPDDRASGILGWNAIFESSVSGTSKLSRLNEQISIQIALDGRKAENKSAMLLKHGGSSTSEAAVERALIWLANHQAKDGGWTFAHHQVCNNQCDHPGRFGSSRNGATALALLPFLGAGQTHLEGEHKLVINRGIDYLLNSQHVKLGSRPTGSWHEPGGTMYSHCLASIAICEAYAMTGDSRLRGPAQLSLEFLVHSQDRTGGGWRYEPHQPGDTSVVGWAVMAIKSGKMGGLEVSGQALEGVDRFLNSVGSRHGANYGYVNQRLMIDGGRPTTAIGLLCRMYQGVSQTNSALIIGSNQLAAQGPRLQNLYYTYYAAQVLRHLGGTPWEKWNQAMRDPLIELQLKSGHASGSWRPNPFPEMGGTMGGRLYSTCMATMILEVYYRHLPLYTENSIRDEFEL